MISLLTFRDGGRVAEAGSLMGGEHAEPLLPGELRQKDRMGGEMGKTLYLPTGRKNGKI